MQQVTVNTYKFSELPSEIQQGIIEKRRHILVQDEWWWYPIIEGFIEDMKTAGHTVKLDNIQFTGFWSHGDGLSFTTDWDDLDLAAILKQLGLDSTQAEGVSIRLSRTSSHYLHENSVCLEVYGGEVELDRVVIEQVEDYLRSLMNRLYRDLEKYWYELTADEAVKAELEDLDLDYLIDGRSF